MENRLTRQVNTKPSIRDLAKLAGVSRTTVSLALRDSREIAEETRAKIQALAHEKGYRSNPMVSALMQQVASRKRIHSGETIAAITSHDEEHAWRKNPWVSEVIRGAEEECRQLGFDCRVFWSGPRARDMHSLAHVLYSRGIRGPVFLPIEWPHPVLDVPWEQFMPVTCSPSTNVLMLPCVTSNHARGMQMLLSQLRQRGARRAGVMLIEEADRRVEHRFSDAARGFGARHRDFHVSLLALKGGTSAERFHHWFERNRPDVLVAMASHVPVEDWLKPLGHKVGRTVGLALLDVAPGQEGVYAGLVQNTEIIGREAIRLISHSLYNNTPGLPDTPRTVLIDPVFRDGASLNCLHRRT
jgi:LacI family transcriptional regulator